MEGGVVAVFSYCLLASISRFKGELLHPLLRSSSGEPGTFPQDFFHNMLIIPCRTPFELPLKREQLFLSTTGYSVTPIKASPFTLNIKSSFLCRPFRARCPRLCKSHLLLLHKRLGNSALAGYARMPMLLYNLSGPPQQMLPLGWEDLV